MTPRKYTLKLSEHEIQTQVVTWARTLETAYPDLVPLYAIPNGAKLPYKKDERGRRYSPQGIKLVAEGMRKGVPDLHLPVARHGYHSLYIEMKRPGEKPSPEQEDMIRILREHGNRVVVCFSFDQARATLVEYLNLPAHLLEES